MARNDPVSPKEYVQEFIKVLTAEIEELKKSKENNIALKNGTLQKGKYGQNVYRFETDRQISILDNVAYKLIAGATIIECDLLSADGNKILLKASQTVAIHQNIMLYIDRTALPEKLLQCFKASLSDAESRYANAARLFHGQFQTASQEVPDLSGYKKVNDFQKAAVVRSFQGDAIIWGPPGTGKTHTIAVAINEQIRRGRRVLLLSHANTAVDGAMEELAELLSGDPVYTQGHLVRMGTSHVDHYPMLSLDEIIQVKAEELDQEVNELDRQKVPLQEKLAGLLKICDLIDLVLQKQGELCRISQLFNEQEQKIKRYCTEADQHAKVLASLEADLSRLENKIFQTRKIRSGIAATRKKIDETRAFASARRIETDQLRAQQKTLSLEIAKLDQQAQSDRREIQLALSCAGVSASALQGEIKALQNKIEALEDRIHDLEHRMSSLRKQVIEEASVIGATLSMAFMSNELRSQEYDTLFIDEISMAPLPAVFFAMGLARSSCTLIGDFLQLPPIGGQSRNELLQRWQNQSFFDRIGVDTVSKARRSEFVKPLNIQYRMNPAIASIANELFYSGILESGGNTAQQVLSDKWSGDQPLVLVDTSKSDPWMNKGPNGQSRCNLCHASLAAAMACEYLEYKRDGKELTIGVVVPYRPQKDLINDILDEALGKISDQRRRIEVNTIHSFQGGEKDIVICDSVESGGLETKWFFFDESSRDNHSANLMLNVALTRAKCKFVLLANGNFINTHFKGHSFRELLKLLKARGKVLSSLELGVGYRTSNGEEDEIRRLSKGASVEELEQYNQTGFWTKVISDLKNATMRAVIFCPFVQEKRIQFLLPIFQEMIGAGVTITIYTKPVNEHEKEYQKTARKLIDYLRRQGLAVRIRKNMHEKVILIDDKLVWQGSLNLLSHTATTEQMQRIASEKIQKAVSAAINLEDYKKIEEAVDPALKCELCGGSLLIKHGKFGEMFYGCNSFPDCGFTKST